MKRHQEHRRFLQNARSNPTPAAFVDSDAIVEEEVPRLHDRTEVKLCQGGKGLIEATRRCHWNIVVKTIQSGVAREYLHWNDNDRVTDRVFSLLRPSGTPSGINVDGHGPDARIQSCGEVTPSMLIETCSEFNRVQKNSMLDGVSLSDLQVGAVAGIRTLKGVLSRHGRKERVRIKASQKQAKSFARGSKTELLLLDSLLYHQLSISSPRA